MYSSYAADPQPYHHSRRRRCPAVRRAQSDLVRALCEEHKGCFRGCQREMVCCKKSLELGIDGSSTLRREKLGFHETISKNKKHTRRRKFFLPIVINLIVDNVYKLGLTVLTRTTGVRRQCNVSQDTLKSPTLVAVAMLSMRSRILDSIRAVARCMFSA